MSSGSPSRPVQQLGGALLAVLGGVATVWVWCEALAGKGFGVKAAAFFPMISVTGLALVLLPGYREERLARGEDVSRLSGTDLLTTRWWAVLVVALAVGFGNFVLLMRAVSSAPDQPVGAPPQRGEPVSVSPPPRIPTENVFDAP